VSILIGADYYWTFVEDKIIRGDGPTAQQSKLGLLYSVFYSSIVCKNENLKKYFKIAVHH